MSATPLLMPPSLPYSAATYEPVTGSSCWCNCSSSSSSSRANSRGKGGRAAWSGPIKLQMHCQRLQRSPSIGRCHGLPRPCPMASPSAGWTTCTPWRAAGLLLRYTGAQPSSKQEHPERSSATARAAGQHLHVRSMTLTPILAPPPAQGPAPPLPPLPIALNGSTHLSSPRKVRSKNNTKHRHGLPQGFWLRVALELSAPVAHSAMAGRIAEKYSSSSSSSSTWAALVMHPWVLGMICLRREWMQVH